MKHKSIVWRILTSFTATLSPFVVRDFVAREFWLIKPHRRTQESQRGRLQRRGKVSFRIIK